MQRRRLLFAAVAMVFALVLALASSAWGDSDLNNDGFDDLAVGVPSEGIGGQPDAGVINILKGGPGGIVAKGDKLFDQADLDGTVELDDRFGNSITYGDFDGDGFDDLAVGAPAEDWSGKKNAGVVHVIYGSANGANRNDTQLISQQGPMAGFNQAGDFFGTPLNSGDFNGDGFDDLAIGVVGENVKGRIAAGGVLVAYGSPSGIRTQGSQFMTERGKVPGRAEPFDGFGFALAVGNFNNDNFDDLAIGTPGEDVDGRIDAGGVKVLYGTSSGIDRSGEVFHKGIIGISPLTACDRLGSALAAGDFDNDGDDDLAIGVLEIGVDGVNPPCQTGASVEGPGSIIILQGNPGAEGIGLAGARTITQGDIAGGQNEVGDNFGFALAAGKFDGGADDLAVGIPKEDVNGNIDAGRVVIILGSPGGGLNTATTQTFTQGDLGGEVEPDDQFGTRLRVGNYNGDGFDDLAISSPFEDVKSRIDNGIVHIAYGSGTGISTSGVDKYQQGGKAVKGAGESGDRFGEGL